VGFVMGKKPTVRKSADCGYQLAELERGLIIERTRAGMKAARARGVRPGPKPKLSRQQIDHARKLIDEGQRRADMADLFKVGRVTLYRALVSR